MARNSPFIGGANHGAAIIEALIVLPLLIALFFGISGVASYGRVYMALSQIVRTSAMGAAVYPAGQSGAMTVTSGDINSFLDGCVTPSASQVINGRIQYAANCREIVLQDRFQKLLISTGLGKQLSAPVTISANLISISGLQVLQVTVNTSYDTHIPFVGKVRLQVKSDAEQVGA